MKLKFNEYGWIKCFEMVNDGQGGHFIWRRFDTKAAALRWVRENPEMRAVCAECLQLPAPAKPEYLPADRRSDDMKPLADGDYKADDSCAVWVDVRGFTVYLHATDEGIIVDVFNAEQLRAEPFAEPVASTYAFDHELA